MPVGGRIKEGSRFVQMDLKKTQKWRQATLEVSVGRAESGVYKRSMRGLDSSSSQFSGNYSISSGRSLK